MPLPILLPAAAFLGLAILADLKSHKEDSRHKKSIEACTATMRATWIKKDGVIQIYHEVGSLNCARIVVECSRPLNEQVPGEFNGYPVMVRMRPEEFGVLTGASGIRGVESFKQYSAAEADAIRRDQAAQGFTMSSVAPPG